MKTIFKYLLYTVGQATIQTNDLPSAQAFAKGIDFCVDLREMRYTKDGVNWVDIAKNKTGRPTKFTEPIKTMLVLFFMLAGMAGYSQPLPVRAVSFTLPQNNEYFTHPFQWSLAGIPEVLATCESVAGAAINCNGITVQVRYGTTPYTFMARDAEIFYDIENNEMHYLYSNTDSRMEVTFDRTGIPKYATFVAGDIVQRPKLIFILENIIP
jgi:hypothetical protein